MRLMEWLFGTGDDEDEVARLEAELGKLTRERAQLLRSLEVAWQVIRALRDVNADLDGKLHGRR
jgi:hypothetical protein